MSPIHCLRQAVRCQLVYAVAVKGKQGVLREISVDRQTPPPDPAGGGSVRSVSFFDPYPSFLMRSTHSPYSGVVYMSKLSSQL